MLLVCDLFSWLSSVDPGLDLTRVEGGGWCWGALVGTLCPCTDTLRGAEELSDGLGEREGVKDLWERSEIQESGDTDFWMVPEFSVGEGASSDSKAEGGLLIGWIWRGKSGCGCDPGGSGGPGGG